MRLDLQPTQIQGSSILGQRETSVAFLQSTKGGHHMAKQLMFSRGIRSEEFDFDLILYIVLAQVRRTNLNLIETMLASLRPLDF